MTGWPEADLGDVASLDARRHDGSRRPFVGLEHIEPGTGRLLRDVGQINAESGTFAFGPEHVLYGRLRPYLNKVHLPEFEGHCSTEIYPILPHAELDRRYLFFWLTAKTTVDSIMATCTGARMPRANLREVLKLTIPLPPLAEQQRIAAMLDAACGEIEAAVASAQTKLREVSDLKKALFSDYVFAEAHQEARTVKVRDLAQNAKGAIRTGPFGSQLLHSEFVDSGIAVLGIDNVVTNQFRWSKRRYISPAKYEQMQRYTVGPGDVLISIMGTCGRCAIVPDDIPVAINSKHLCCISLDRTLCLPEYLWLYFLHHPKAQEFLNEKAKGSIMAGLNMEIIRDLPVVLPNLDEQRLIVARYRTASDMTDALSTAGTGKLSLLAELKQSFIARAFSGKMTAESGAANDNTFATPEQAANILAFMHWRHEQAHRSRFFGHVMAQKSLDLVERVGGVELGRAPYKDAAGPNDKPHMSAAEIWAKENQFFEFVERGGGGYDFKKLANYGVMLSAAQTALKPVEAELGKVSNILVGKDKVQAEIFATVLAAWNNLISDGKEATEAAILREARDNWHPDKIHLPIAKFQDAIREIRRLALVPDGTAKAVRHKQAALF